MNTLIWIGCFEALLLSLLLIFKKKKAVHDKFLFSYLLIIGLNLFLFAIDKFNMQNNFPYPNLLMWRVPLTVLHGPFLWFYIKSLKEINFKFKILHLFHFLPFILILINIIQVLYTVNIPARIEIVQTASYQQALGFKLLSPLIMLSGPSYIIWGLILLKKHRTFILNNFSFTENISLRWLRVFLWGSFIVWLFVFVGGILSRMPSHGLEINKYHSIVFILLSIFVFVIGFYGLKQTSIFTSVTVLEKDYTKQSEPKTTSQNNVDDTKETLISKDDKNYEILKQLLDYMEMEKPYLNPELNIGILANKLRVHSHLLSKLINTNMQQNFFEFVNHYRIEEFKRQIQDARNKNYSIIAVALDSGFNSKPTFNRIFKNAIGITPSQYKESLQN